MTAPTTTIRRADVAALMANTMGQERAAAVVDEAADGLQLGATLSPAEALRLLEHVAAAPGVTGIAARFAKSRALLRWGSI
jgi:hypothetical protein